MHIITISREFGSGGRELGKRLAEYLDCDYYDNEIITAVAKKSELDADYVGHALQNHGWKSHSISLRSSFGAAHMQANQVSLLLKQKEVIESIAALGKDCVIVGRNADVILRRYRPFNVFVCATQQAKLQRCRERASADEHLTDREMLKKMKQIDSVRSQTREILTGSGWGQRDEYHLTVNTTDWEIKELVPAVADFAARWFGGAK